MLTAVKRATLKVTFHHGDAIIPMMSDNLSKRLPSRGTVRQQEGCSEMYCINVDELGYAYCTSFPKE